MRVLLSISALVLFTSWSGCLAFDFFANPFHREIFNEEESIEDLWPFVRHNSRERLPSNGNSGLNERDTEPIDLSYVEGPIVDPDSPSQSPLKPSKVDYNYHNTNAFLNNHFGNFFGPGVFSNPFDSFGLFNFPRYQPWWKGPNVCKIREEDIEEEEENDKPSENSSTIETKDNPNEQFLQAFQLNLETCVEKPNKYQCTKIMNQGGRKKTFTITYKCCAGFGRQRRSDTNSQCEKLELENLPKTLENLGAKEFMRSAKNTLADQDMNSVTIFAPIDESFTDFSEKMFENNLVVVPLTKRMRREIKDEQSVNTKDLVNAHMVEGIHDIEEIENEQTLVTKFNTTIRLNVFPRPPSDKNFDFPYQYTANCVPIVKPNVMASNGMIHMIKGVLVPPEKTVMELLKERPDMAVFTTVLERTKLDKMLMDETKHFTILAPTDSAFEKLDPQLRKKIKEGRGCASNILRNHMLDLTFCSSAVANNAKTSAYNMLGEKLEFEIDEDAAKKDGNEVADMTNARDIIINGDVRMIEVDLMGTNGVVHIIDTTLQTESAQPVTETLKQHNSTIFEKLLVASNLEDYINDMMNSTVFAPIDKAFENSENGQYWLEMLEKSPDQLQNNIEFKEFVDNHISQPMIKTCDLADGRIKSKSENDLRVNLYATNFPFVNIMNRATLNCARLVHFDEDSCGSVVHQVDKILEPPKKNLLETLQSNGKYSSFLKLIEATNLTSILEDRNQNLTLLVPKNEVFDETDNYSQEILSDNARAEYFVKAHILSDVLCCAGISQSQWPFVRTIPTINNVNLRIDRDRRPKIQNAGVTKCDIISTNGIIHEINDFITIPEKPQHQNPFQEHFEHFFKK